MLSNWLLVCAVLSAVCAQAGRVVIVTKIGRHPPHAFVYNYLFIIHSTVQLQHTCCKSVTSINMR
jgi:hypothetical protein